MSEYVRARRDVGFRERVAAGYSGSHEVLDALWWREHPDAATPDGTPSPRARRAELQRVAFAPAARGAADAVPRADRATAELRRLDQSLTEERAAIDRAVEAALTIGGTERMEGPAPGPVGEAPDDAGATGDEHPAGGSRSASWWWGRLDGSRRHGRGDSRRTPGRRTAAVAAVFAVAVVGGAAGYGLAQLGAGADGTGSPAAGGEPFADASSALAIFDRPQQDDDVPPLLYNVQLREETLRTLSMPAAPLYVARDIDDDVCVVLVQTNGTYAANCVPEDRFPSSGLLIRGSIAVTGRPSQGDQLPQSFVDVEATWLPDGTTVWGRNPRT